MRYTAAVLVIGNEILSGRTRDANVGFIGGELLARGIRLVEARVVRDERPAIIAAVNELRSRFDYLFTTGGIGPTHDDITTAAVAAACGVEVSRHGDAAERLRTYYGDDGLTAARLKMADIPDGAELIDNPVSAAPGFRLGNVFALPGIPRILQAMFRPLAARLAGGEPIVSRALHAWVAESSVAAPLGDIQRNYPGLDIGSYPFARDNRFGTTLVVSGPATAGVDDAVRAIAALLQRRGAEFTPAATA